MGDDIRNGKRYEPSKFYQEIIDNHKCFMTSVLKENYNSYVGYGLWYYQNNNFPLLQCIYPTLSGIYPWEPDWPEVLRDIQPVLGIIEK